MVVVDFVKAWLALLALLMGLVFAWVVVSLPVSLQYSSSLGMLHPQS